MGVKIKRKLAQELTAGDVLLPGNEVVVETIPDGTTRGRGLHVVVLPPAAKQPIEWWVPLRHLFEVRAGGD
jgi:hypothetical protein